MTTRSLAALKEIIQTKRDAKQSWRDIADEFGVNAAVIWRIANEGYEPKLDRIRKLLGLSEIITQEVTRNGEGRFTKEDE